MMRRLTILAAGVAFLSTAQPATAYFERVQAGARATAFGRAYSAIADDASALFYNPAAMVTMNRGEAMFMLAKPFNIEGYDAAWVAMALPRGRSAAGFYWHHAGVDGVMGEDLIGLGLARDLLPAGGNLAWSIGGDLKVAHVGFSPQGTVDYGSKTAFTTDLSTFVNAGAQLAFSYTVHNLVEAEIEFVDGGGGTRLERTHDLSGSYRWNPASTVAVAVSTDPDGSWHPHMGGEVWFHDVFGLRSGFRDREFAGGVGLKARQYLIDVAFLTDADLGASYEVAVRVPFGARRW